MPSELPTLARVLAALDAGAIHDEGATQRRCADAARLLRALAADFGKVCDTAEALGDYVQHAARCASVNRSLEQINANVHPDCNCALDALMRSIDERRSRWRLDAEGDGKQ